MKKILALIIALMMVAGCFAACNSTPAEQPKAEEPAAAAAPSEPVKGGTVNIHRRPDHAAGLDAPQHQRKRHRHRGL